MKKIPTNITIETERLLLVKPTTKDWKFVYENIKLNKDYPKVTRVPKNYTKDMAKEFIKKISIFSFYVEILYLVVIYLLFVLQTNDCFNISVVYKKA